MRTYTLTNPLQHHEDIKNLQRALKANKFYNGAIDGIFGRGTAQGCRKAKYRLGYPRKAVKYSGGQQLLNFLNGTKPLPAAFQVRRHARGFGIDRRRTIRQAIVSHALWGVANSGAISYAQIRPMENLYRVHRLPWSCDCSEFVTTIYKWAGAPDPNGFGYNGLGYTGTMLDNGISVPRYEAQLGDAVIWGFSPGHHTAVIVDVSNPSDPMLVSMGSDRDPRKISLSYETGAQNRPYVIKNYLGRYQV
jgi:hypothetical protein